MVRFTPLNASGFIHEFKQHHDANMPRFIKRMTEERADRIIEITGSAHAEQE